MTPDPESAYRQSIVIDGYDAESIGTVLGGNWLRPFQRVWDE